MYYVSSTLNMDAIDKSTGVPFQYKVVFLPAQKLPFSRKDSRETYCLYTKNPCPDSKVHGANMGPTWVLVAPDGPMLAQWTLQSGYIWKVVLILKTGAIVPNGSVMCVVIHRMILVKSAHMLCFQTTYLELCWDWCVICMCPVFSDVDLRVIIS